MQKNIVITGGSSGIGEGLAKHFYNKGWRVLTTGRNNAKLSKLAAELPGIYTIVYDSLKNAQENKIIDFIKDEWNGKLDVLVNNAGHVAITPLPEISRDQLEEMYQVHLIAPSLLTAGCVPFLSATKGQIINVSSSHGIKAYAQLSAYGSAKSGLNMLTKIWALELAPLGIRVNCVAPGPTDTPVLENAGLSADIILAIQQSEAKTIPLQKRGDVEDIVANTALLIDSGSNWVTGVVLPVDGGISVS
ncbi:NAD(P)-dependent dehydrogenase (short-subunit alcohol dehydrogenase family) [Mucilaginibacter sp. SG538B]|uniref:SDR family NAD(P)-dependent oxidoreductase n=1 Tax=Mucilaginibacter sp. SG538B TaxID=2587021 RepID=UPI00159E1807|nr:SDR family oxidoreductase [Mucilaginibacter sp. SG538B]NVM67673.1 NAD(P)-dependent dehydrogenase (short-subunit alcohol dehydrogenase family) [Mucilaginibacter sp. SG538B]